MSGLVWGKPEPRPEPWVVVMRSEKEDWNSRDERITWWETSDVIGPFTSQQEAAAYAKTHTETYLECEVLLLCPF